MSDVMLDEYSESVLRFVESSSPTDDEISNEFMGVLTEKQMKYAINALLARKYISTEQQMRGFSNFEGNDDLPTYTAYTLSPLGKNFLANRTQNFTSFTNISNSNIAHHSPNARQSINIQDQPQDIQEKVKELELALLKKDGPAMKKIFGYIADKSVDVAIALVLGGLRHG